MPCPTPTELPRSLVVVGDLIAERRRQDAKWGQQNHPDGTADTSLHDFAGRWSLLADSAREDCQRAASQGKTTWLLILREEVYEAFTESDPAKLRAELVQVMAVVAAWIECIDRRVA